ncbi:hypothetical protein EDC56_2191 [Sinobacterium caligoides]|uniref:Uncharacterized protein n=1 Tax=Sinobacterium caligoides TaxID=933926 RepID=A0A3N2DPM6_9GAMM|nr:hypothetical protein [Sinobacterium caligoides]ROS01746.1 hypothetical protein EDC56_2191 [Sinobacterium caligoides]
MKSITILMLSLLCAPLWAESSGRQITLQPFSSDGCSAFPDGTLSDRRLWHRCCAAHDLAYWRGGSYRERLFADQELERCVSEVADPELALLMMAGVRVGGTPLIPTSFRWGYGWPYPHLYHTLTAWEQKQVRYLQPSAAALALFEQHSTTDFGQNESELERRWSRQRERLQAEFSRNRQQFAQLGQRGTQALGERVAETRALLDRQLTVRRQMLQQLESDWRRQWQFGRTQVTTTMQAIETDLQYWLEQVEAMQREVEQVLLSDDADDGDKKGIERGRR